MLDGGFSHEKTGYDAEARQGQSSLTWLTVNGEEWTVLCILDRTIDRRGSNHSVFLLRGSLAWRQAVSTARDAFPHVIGRLTCDLNNPLRLVQVRLGIG